jgi:hypothetical protein
MLHCGSCAELDAPLAFVAAQGKTTHTRSFSAAERLLEIGRRFI